MNLKNLSDAALIALMRVAKTRARAFFKHPRDIMALREELEFRSLKKPH